jgi:tRNA pseudouridine32 synthase/23S rRNA pseudouridine746 synthase
MLELEPLLIHRDASVLVINKPANIAVHKGFGDDDTLEKYFHQLQFGLPQTPHLAHRLDRATSGCLVLGRHRQALARLSHLFASQQVDKRYLAVVLGEMKQKEGSIDLKIAKKEQAKHRWWMKVDENGQEARTDYKVLSGNDRFTFVELSPKTGRTHQLRVHLAAIGHPILGEWIYQGEAVMPKAMLQLHASAITLPFHDKKPPIHAEAALPDHMKAVLEKEGLS